MQIYQVKEVEMERNMDLIRDLLVNIADDPKFDGCSWISPGQPSDLGISAHSMEEVSYHLVLLIEAGFIKGKEGMDVPVICKLTWQGHEFLDNIRDQGIWAKTKQRLSGLSGVGLSVIAQVAEAEIKKRIGL